MTTPIDVTLTGSDGPVEGLATAITYDGQAAYEFLSTDETLHLVIAKDNHNQWHRVAGTEPYFGGWADELAEQVTIIKRDDYI